MTLPPATSPKPGKRAAWAALGPRQNQLLAALPDPDYELVLPHLEPVPVPGGMVLCHADVRARYAYFPTTAIISLQQILAGKPSSEVAIAGRDGMCGISIVMGDMPTSRRSTVHCAGHAYRIKAEALRELFAESQELRSLLLRYAQVQMAQVAQNAVCYRLHSVEQQVCRRLLMSLDRLLSPEIPVTHEVLACALGVRREAVTLATCRLFSEGLLHCSRGRIVVLDRPALERRSCECYAALQHEASRLMPPRQSSFQVA